MKVLFDIGHPAHVHLIRNTYHQLMADGHQVIVTTKDIPTVIRLLDIYGIPFVSLGSKHDSLTRKGLDQLRYNLSLWWLVWRKRIEVGVHGITVAHVSKLSPMKSILPDDDDDEVEPLFAKYGHPFADTILTPSAICRKSKKTVYVDSYHELAYLHPNCFAPDPSVLHEAGLKKGETFFILRFNAFKAHHDTGAQGLTIENKRRLVELLKTCGRVLITTERNIEEEFKPYQLQMSPEKAHSLMYYATMLVGDSQTMTSEAAVLGTPAVKCNSFAGRLSVPNELEHRYELCFSFLPNQSEAFFAKIDELLAMPNLKEEWQLRRQKMLSEKIDYSAFLIWFIENYPDSREVMKNDPDYQFRFK